MTSFVTSSDGTPIAFDRLGEGPPVVVAGASAIWLTTQDLAEQLAHGDSPEHGVSLALGESAGSPRSRHT